MSKKLSFSNLTNNRQKGSVPVVAIGASAGGLKALQQLLEHVPSETGLAFVYIQHLDPSHESSLSEIMGRATTMKVVEATQMIPVEANHVYIIPPDKGMGIVDGVLTLEPRSKTDIMHTPVNKFLISLADNHKHKAIGILLSGTSNDGVLGLKAVKLAGGITIAQDDSAEFQSMPKAAIAEGVVDLILSPEKIAQELERLSKQADFINVASAENADSFIEDSDESLIQIIQLLKKNIGVDFTHYKMNTIKRRIVRRMLLNKLNNLSEYLDYLKQTRAELNALYQDLLINVTSFFRDPETLEHLKKTCIPKIIKNRQQGESIRIWVPACSTGEEAYSLAMTFMEVLGARAASIPVQIFATDLSELMITKARLGIYSKNELLAISPKRLETFFTKIDGSYRISKSIRDMCVFAPHNIFRDPPFSRIDIISCCNLMIYLDPVLQKKILNTFHYALNQNGVLVLGKSETIGASTQLFSHGEKKFKVFIKKSDSRAPGLPDSVLRMPIAERTHYYELKKTKSAIMDYTTDLEKKVDDVLLSKYVPASVVVNQDLEIQHFRGSTGLYLEPLPGRASLNLLKMARPGLGLELRNVVHKSNKAGQAVKKEGIEIKLAGKLRRVSLEITPLRADGDERLFLVVFEQVEIPELEEVKSGYGKDKLVRTLEDELKVVREDLRSIIEEQQAGNEELQTANEEIVSSNEELQSINEELETSKEELESSNEELMTINTELQIRNEQLAESYEYAEAVFGTIREGVLVLDRDLRIKTANKSFYKIFNLAEEETEGVVIYELDSQRWNIPELHRLFENLLSKNNNFTGLKIRWAFPRIGPKILILNACKITQKIHQKEVFLLAFEDITDIKEKREDGT